MDELVRGVCDLFLVRLLGMNRRRGNLGEFFVRGHISSAGHPVVFGNGDGRHWIDPPEQKSCVPSVDDTVDSVAAFLTSQKDTGIKHTDNRGYCQRIDEDHRRRK